MNVDELISYALEKLPEDIKNNPGRILYSHERTLEASDVYLIGLNPGGDEDGACLKKEIRRIKGRDKNAYVDESWEWGDKQKPPGESLLQVRVTNFVKDLGQHISNVCASNLIFTQTASQNDLKNAQEKAKDCWLVHEQIIKMVKPKVIAAIGTGRRFSAYTFLKSKLKPSGDETRLPVGKYRASCYWYKTEQNVLVIGVPHLSRYAIHDRDGKPLNGVDDLIKVAKQFLVGNAP